MGPGFPPGGGGAGRLVPPPSFFAPLQLSAVLRLKTKVGTVLEKGREAFGPRSFFGSGAKNYS